MATGGAAPATLAGALRANLPPDVTLLLVCADQEQPTTVRRAPGARVVELRALDDLPRALPAAVHGVSA
jgi:hypothetical protein